MIVAGIGCRRGCPAAAIETLLDRAEAQAGVRADLLASAAVKADEPGLTAVAALRERPLRLIAPDALLAAAPRCASPPSAAALRAHGVPSVAEAAALAAGGPDAVLILPRLTGEGVTCALARVP